MPTPRPAEQLIGALVPAALPRPRPMPAPIADLPPRGHVDPAAVVFATARLDPSGRVSVRAMLATLGWSPGDRIDVAVRHASIVITCGGRYVIGGRGEVGLPAAARQVCDIAAGSVVVLAALARPGLLVVHSSATVASYLRRLHLRLSRDGRGC